MESEGRVQRRCRPVGASSTACTSVGSGSMWACSRDGSGSSHQTSDSSKIHVYIILLVYESLLSALIYCSSL
jgi:hypothetical protein